MRLIFNFLIFILINSQAVGMIDQALALPDYKYADARIKEGDALAIKGFVKSYKQEFNARLAEGITAGELRAHIKKLELLCAETQKTENKFKSYVTPSVMTRFTWLGALGLRAGAIEGATRMIGSVLTPYILKNRIKAWQLSKGICSAATREAARQAAAEHGTTYSVIVRDFFAIPLIKRVSACVVGAYAITKIGRMVFNYVKPTTHFILFKSKRQEEFVKRQSINEDMQKLLAKNVMLLKTDGSIEVNHFAPCAIRELAYSGVFADTDKLYVSDKFNAIEVN